MRRLEHAQLTAECQTINKQAKTANVNDDIHQDLEKRYQMSISWKDHVNLYSYVSDNQGDPAFKVCLHVPCTQLGMGVLHQ